MQTVERTWWTLRGAPVEVNSLIMRPRSSICPEVWFSSSNVLGDHRDPQLPSSLTQEHCACSALIKVNGCSEPLSQGWEICDCWIHIFSKMSNSWVFSVVMELIQLSSCERGFSHLIRSEHSASTAPKKYLVNRPWIRLFCEKCVYSWFSFIKFFFPLYLFRRSSCYWHRQWSGWVWGRCWWGQWATNLWLRVRVLRWKTGRLAS